jgi:tyrosine-protein kinase Etk/Wzc
MSNIQPVRSDQGTVNIKELFFKYLRFLPLFILSLALSLTVAYIYLRYTTPVYQSGGSLVLKDQQSIGAGDQNEKFQQLFVDDRSKNIQNEIEYLKSQPLMERVVDALHLNFSYYAKGKVKEQNVYRNAPFHIETVTLRDTVEFKVLITFKNNFSFTINKDSKTYSFGEVFPTEHGDFRLVRNSSSDINKEYRIIFKPTPSMASLLRSTIAVSPKSNGSGILLISMESDNPFLAADVINQLMKEYQQATIEDKNITTRQMIQFIDGRLKIVSHELDSATDRMLAYKQLNNIQDVEGTSSYFSKVEETNKQLEDQRMQLNVLQLIQDYINDSKNATNLVPSSFTITDPTLGGLISAYNTAQLERKNMIDSQIPAENPKVKQKDDQLAILRKNILENIRNLRNVYNSFLDNTYRRNAVAESELRSLPVKQQNLIEIKRQLDNKLAIYNLLVGKREESAISLAATISNIKVLDHANPNLTPVNPKPRSIQTIALIIGLIIPSLIVFIMELLDDKIKTREDIEKLTNATILGEVGHSAEESTLIVTPKSRGFVAEQFRIIRSNLQYVVTQTPNPVILVTSSFSGEGKSFISTNLGAVIALAGKKTIILEFDIRKPKILAGLNIPKRPGLTNYLLGTAKLEDLPVPVSNYENLYVLACGPLPPNPSEILLDPKLSELFVYLKQNFDVVVMDTAPVGMVSDALTLSQFADCCMYIVRQGVTHKKQISLLEEYNSEQKLPKVSIVLNDIKLRAGYGYYYGRYGYGYGYGSNSGYGYYDEEKSTSFISRWFGWTGKLNGVEKKKKKNTV